MTRPEEGLRLGTRQCETGRAELRKYVVAETVTKTVLVEREEVRVECEPITDANRDHGTSRADISEEEHEVVLHEEEPVVEKRAVAPGADAAGRAGCQRRARGFRGSPQGADRYRGLEQERDR